MTASPTSADTPAEAQSRAAGAVSAPPVHPDPLHARAARLWPDSEAMQAEWVRAVGVVRASRHGWVLDSGSSAPDWHAWREV